VIESKASPSFSEEAEIAMTAVNNKAITAYVVGIASGLSIKGRNVVATFALIEFVCS
jgi:hypothetical protein